MTDTELDAINETIDQIIDLLPDVSRTGINDFDKAWTLLRIDRAGIAPKSCVMSRRLVLRFLEELKEYYEV